jgi:peroxiredoxin
MTETNASIGGAFLVPGQTGPDFILPSSLGPIELSGLRGRPAILAFYPGDFSPVCSDQMSLYESVLPELQRYDAALLGISVDSVWSHRAFAEQRNLSFPLLADFEPKGRVARMYGSYDSREGVAERALFVLDDRGVIVWSYLSPKTHNPGADGILAALESLRDGGAPVVGRAPVPASNLASPAGDEEPA